MSYVYEIGNSETPKYKTYFTFNKKRFYLGSFNSKDEATQAAQEAYQITHSNINLEKTNCEALPFNKVVILINFRDNGTYFNNPIYVRDNHFSYFINNEVELLFDMIHLFFFSTHKIYQRNQLFYTQHKFTQLSILNRLGIIPSSKVNKDYFFINGNIYDFRKDNLKIIKNYFGVSTLQKDEKTYYRTTISMPNTVVVGTYESEIQAAIAYNKALIFLKEKGVETKAKENNIPYLTKKEYDALYHQVELSPKFMPHQNNNQTSYKGVTPHPSGFRASIGYKSKQIYLGLYPTALRAAQAYNLASYLLKGQKGYRNPTSPLFNFKDELKIIQALEKNGWQRNSS
ncbi:MAG: hypothetical protein ATN36_00750 [Epulopiscium sp. Nele67-Bin005]|nr:MAG: hypothetical protein ATN36_00750 [Epulopiscium sp. Nele67-Bin005]